MKERKVTNYRCDVTVYGRIGCRLCCRLKFSMYIICILIGNYVYTFHSGSKTFCVCVHFDVSFCCIFCLFSFECKSNIFNFINEQIPIALHIVYISISVNTIKNDYVMNVMLMIMPFFPVIF